MGLAFFRRPRVAVAQPVEAEPPPEPLAAPRAVEKGAPPPTYSMERRGGFWTILGPDGEKVGKGIRDDKTARATLLMLNGGGA